MPTAPCYATGTRIATIRGEVAVEDLAVGDLALTAAGDARPIRWIGHRRIACRAHGFSENVMPVRVARDAFGSGRPGRDLLVSPGHGVCVDVLGEVLIPIIALANGATVAQLDVEHVTYWHVELDGHDILLAEGLPAESYLDVGNRDFFAEGGDSHAVADLRTTQHADLAERVTAVRCRPYYDSGVLCAILRERLRERALALGWRLERDLWNGTSLLVDGARIDPVVEGLSGRFAMPADAEEIWLVSETTVPNQIGESTDERVLGVCVEGLVIDGGTRAAWPVDLAHPLLCVGFHDIEEGSHRWTAGRARLPRALWDQRTDAYSLRLDLADSMLPRWRPPRAVGWVVGDEVRAERRIA